MAVITDVLETVLQLSGVTQYVTQMQVATGAVVALKDGQIAAAEATLLLERSMGALTATLAAVAAAAAAVGGVGFQGLRQFASDEQVWVKLARALHNVGSAMPFAEVKAYAEARQEATGIDDEATAALIRQLVQLRFNTREWQQLVPVLQDAEAAGLGTAESIARAIRRFQVSGRTQALSALGINIEEVRRSADQIGDIIEQLRRKSQGAVEDRFRTLGGAFQDLKDQLGNLFSSIGDALAPIVIPVVRWLRDQVVGITKFINDTLDRLGVPRQSQIDADRIARTAAQEGFGEKDSENLDQIAKTSAQTSAAIRQILGGPGTIGPRSASIRVLRDAFSRA